MKKFLCPRRVKTKKFGILVYYGQVCVLKKRFFAAFHTPEVTPAPRSALYCFLTLHSIRPLPESEKNYEKYLCVKADVLFELFCLLKQKDFKEIAEFSIKHRDLTPILPWVIKTFEFVRSGKRDLYIMEFKIDKTLYYCFPITPQIKTLFLS